MRRSMVIAAVALVAMASAGNLAFNVRPGLLINAAQVGYKGDNFFIGGGLEYASVSWTDSYSRVQHDTFVFPETTYIYKYGATTKASVFLPQVAGKYFWGRAPEGSDAGYARPFVGATAFYSLASASLTRTDGDSTYTDTSATRSLKDVLDGNFGGTLSFGGEYYIARGLSLSAEFGTRFLFGGTDIKYRYDNYQGPEEVALKEKLGLGFTYTTLGLNFYF